mgnify:CR=1 FL=1
MDTRSTDTRFPPKRSEKPTVSELLDEVIWWMTYAEEGITGMYESQKHIEKLVYENQKLKQQLETANQYCEQWGYKWDEKEEVYVNEDDGLSDSEDDE